MFCTSQRNAESLSLSAAHRRRRDAYRWNAFLYFVGVKTPKKKGGKEKCQQGNKATHWSGKKKQKYREKTPFLLLLSLTRPSPKEGRHACKRSKMGKRWFLALPAPFYFRSYRQSQLAKQASSLSMLPHLSDTFVFAEKQSGDWIEAQQLARNVTTTNSSSFPFLFPYRKRIEKLFSHTRFFFLLFFSSPLSFRVCVRVSIDLSFIADYWLHPRHGGNSQSIDRKAIQTFDSK